MMHKIICMPNLNLPIKIDLDTIRNELKQQTAVEKAADVELPNYDSDDDGGAGAGHKSKAFNVLPLYKPPNKILKAQLSLKHNEYLALKFDKYLAEENRRNVHVRLYHDIKAAQSAPKPRHMKLNGKFYDVDNKLAPAPYFPDPRQYTKLNSCKKIKSAK